MALSIKGSGSNRESSLLDPRGPARSWSKGFCATKADEGSPLAYASRACACNCGRQRWEKSNGNGSPHVQAGCNFYLFACHHTRGPSALLLRLQMSCEPHAFWLWQLAVVNPPELVWSVPASCLPVSHARAELGSAPGLPLLCIASGFAGCHVGCPTSCALCMPGLKLALACLYILQAQRIQEQCSLLQAFIPRTFVSACNQITTCNHHKASNGKAVPCNLLEVPNTGTSRPALPPHAYALTR